jgi:hypothetical protein
MATHFNTTNIQQLTQQREAIHQRLNQTLSDGLQTFSQTLNSTVLLRITERSTIDFRLYNFIVAEQPIHQRNRLQALHSFPFLAHSIMSDAFAPIRTIIDSGQRTLSHDPYRQPSRYDHDHQMRQAMGSGLPRGAITFRTQS